MTRHDIHTSKQDRQRLLSILDSHHVPCRLVTRISDQTEKRDQEVVWISILGHITPLSVSSVSNYPLASFLPTLAAPSSGSQSSPSSNKLPRRDVTRRRGRLANRAPVRLVLLRGLLASLELLEIPVADLHVPVVVVHALREALGGAGAVRAVLGLVLAGGIRLLRGGLGGRTRAAAK